MSLFAERPMDMYTSSASSKYEIYIGPTDGGRAPVRFDQRGSRAEMAPRWERALLRDTGAQFWVRWRSVEVAAAPPLRVGTLTEPSSTCQRATCLTRPITMTPRLTDSVFWWLRNARRRRR